MEPGEGASWTQLGPDKGISSGSYKHSGAHSYNLHVCDTVTQAGGITQSIAAVAGDFFLVEFWAEGLDRTASGDVRVDVGYVSAGTLQSQPFETLGYTVAGRSRCKTNQISSSHYWNPLSTMVMHLGHDAPYETRCTERWGR